MTKQTQKDNLLNQLSYYGFTLMKPAVSTAPETVLENLLKQDDVRLLEGFPVVLVNAFREKKKLAWEDSKWVPSDHFSKKSLQRFPYLLFMTFLLLRLFGLEKNLEERVNKLLGKFQSDQEARSKMEELFMKSSPVKVDSLEMSPERLTANFRNYVVLTQSEHETDLKKQELELELLLSELFTLRQKELLKKRSTGKPMTKTEKEYFYRVVKKRLRALASNELHQMAQNLLLN